MDTIFYISGIVALLATGLVITRANVVHALLYLIVSLLAVAMVFFSLDAPFVAALEVIIYAGAIMVLFVFVIMMLNLGPQVSDQERAWLSPSAWVGPSVLAMILLAELVYALMAVGAPRAGAITNAAAQPQATDAAAVGARLFGPYMLGVELASLVLLAGLVGAYHLGRRQRTGALP